jgi:type IV pilus assembly protein PilB
MPSNPEETHTDIEETKTGMLLVNEGFIRLADVKTALEIQQRETLQTVCRTRSYPRTIGEILCDLNLITPIDLNAVLKKYRKQLRLEQILIKQGSANEKALALLRQEAARHSEPIGKILLKKGIITETQLYEAYALQHNLPYGPYDRFTPAPENRATLSGIIGKNFARQFGLLPVTFGRQRLGVVISDPENLWVIEALRAKQTDLRIECALVTTGTFNRLFKLLYESPSPIPGSEPAKAPHPLEKTINRSQSVSRVQRPSPSAKEIVQFILSKAIQSNTETIHLHRDEAGASINFLPQGERIHPPSLWFEKRFREIAADVMDRIKEMAGLKQEGPLRPGEGMIQTTYRDQLTGDASTVAFSVATCPALAGEDITISHLSQRQKTNGPVTAMLSEAIRSKFYQLLRKGNGLILVTGSRGSDLGKTVQAALSYIQNPETTIVTLENPIRYHLPGSVQIETQVSKGVPWDILFRSALKLSPDVMVIDMLKDTAAARSVCEFARSGPLFISTLEAEDAINALFQLQTMGIPPYLIADSLGGIFSQQPVKKLCNECKVSYKPPASEWTKLFSKYPDHLHIYRRVGCRTCHFSGYNGQMFLSELLPVTKPLLDAIRAEAPEETLRQVAIEQGMRTLIDDGLDHLEKIAFETLLADIPMSSLAAFKSRRLRDSLAPPGTSVYTEIMSNPATQREAVIRLHTAYERLAIAKGLRTGPSDPHLFGMFIRHHFHQICQRYHCQRVSFRIFDRHPQIIITAMPVQPSD